SSDAINPPALNGGRVRPEASHRTDFAVIASASPPSTSPGRRRTGASYIGTSDRPTPGVTRLSPKDRYLTVGRDPTAISDAQGLSRGPNAGHALPAKPASHQSGHSGLDHYQVHQLPEHHLLQRQRPQRGQPLPVQAKRICGSHRLKREEP